MCGWGAGGYPSQVWMVGGTPSQVWGRGEVPWTGLDGRGYPVPGVERTPTQVWGGGYPEQIWMVGGSNPTGYNFGQNLFCAV